MDGESDVGKNKSREGLQRGLIYPILFKFFKLSNL